MAFERFTGTTDHEINPGTIHASVEASVGKTYTSLKDAPRAVRADANGTLEMVDFNGNTVSYNVVQGEPIPFRPKEITTNTNIKVQVWF